MTREGTDVYAGRIFEVNDQRASSRLPVGMPATRA